MPASGLQPAMEPMRVGVIGLGVGTLAAGTLGELTDGGRRGLEDLFLDLTGGETV